MSKLAVILLFLLSFNPAEISLEKFPEKFR
jgi:hypothetical protein